MGIAAAAEPTVEYACAAEQAEVMWRCQTNAVKSFGRYLSAHADAALTMYVACEDCAERKNPPAPLCHRHTSADRASSRCRWT
jgi:hypothetical protein